MTKLPVLRFCIGCLTALAFTGATRAVDAPAGIEAQKPAGLSWDATEKSFDAKPGDSVAEFQFTVTNRSDKPITILELRPSCSCTIAEMPATPWVIEPGAKGSFRAAVDFTGKQGKFSKTIFVGSSAGPQMLGMTVNIPDSPEALRLRNQQMAQHDRQAIFRGECASCHAAPTVNKTGEELFQFACGICHTAEHRANMVPDLMVVREPRDAAFWRRWITEGKAQTLMPAFAQERGGPLTPAQVDSLVEYVVKKLPAQPQKQ